MVNLALVIPYYKLTFFEETLQSLANQTDKRFKVYIGDDASPEDPTDSLEKYKGKFDFVYHRYENNLGSLSLSQQWERCVALSGNEDWIMILGDDDYLGENVVEQFYAQLPDFQLNANVVRFALQLLYEKDQSKSLVFTNLIWELATDSFYRKFKRLAVSTLSEYVFSKKAYKKFGFHDYPLAWFSDDRAWLDFSEDKPIYSINESIVYARMSHLNISGRQDNVAIKNQSSVAFYQYLIQAKLKEFNKYQRIKIIRKYYFDLKKVKSLERRDWLFLFKYYMINLNFLAIKDFIKKYI
jgi:glycosyltransferase involved in cell wall biosynthesis